MSKLQSKEINGLVAVQEHYQDYPYPFRDPEDEKTRILSLAGEYLGELNHWLYKGKQDFKSGFRVLIAGGGTGDSSTFLGEQLKNTDAEIVYLDFSKPSMEIAMKRAEIRGLKNIKFINDSILNVPKLKLGKFDFINCSGVLHHLESPPAGLKVLKDSLTDTGAINIMIYAKYGRTGVYHVQEIMKMINKGVTNRVEEIMNGKLIVNALPASNWFKRGNELIGDHINFGDVGLYDLFLHKQDRAYSIPEMREFIADAGLNFVQFSDVTEKLALRIESYITDFSLLQKVKKMDIVTQQAICELIVGNIIKHTFYSSNAKEDTVASMEDLNNVPYFYAANGVPKSIVDLIENNSIAAGMTMTFTLNTPFFANANVSIPVSIYTKSIFKNMIEDSKSLQELFDCVRQDLAQEIDDKTLLAEVKTVLTPFFDAGIMLLRDKKIGAFTY